MGEKPAPVRDSGWFGTPYANEHDPSWEDVIAMVVIPGEPDRITAVADKWTVLFTRLREVKRVLDDGIADLANWKGPGGEAYRAHLEQVSKSVGDLIEDHRGLAVSLHTAAADLQTAINEIPIPDDMVHEVMAAKNGFIDTGKISNGLFHPGGIYNYLLPIVGNKWFDAAREFFTWDGAAKKLRDWVSSEDDKARKAYQTLGNHHVNTMVHMPGPMPQHPRDPYQPWAPTNATPKVGGPRGPGGLGTGVPDPSASGLDPSVGGLPGDGRLGDAGGPGTDSLLGTAPAGTGLAGLGDGLVGAVPGAGGAGPAGLGPGSGLGPGGVGGVPGLEPGAGGLGRGIGAGLPGGAVAGGLPLGAGSGSGTRAGTGTNAGKPGPRGGAAGRAGGMGMVPGAGGQGDGKGEDHATWVKEDDNVWGVDGDTPPAVLS